MPVSTSNRGQSASSAARVVLTARLAAVGEHLTRVLNAAAESPEHVHKLRVATRRAVAAVESFAVVLPMKAFRRAKKSLRGLRRVAGAARDWDVFLATLAALPDPPASLPFLFGWAAARRHTAGQALDRLRDTQPADIHDLQAETVWAIRSVRREAQSLADLAGTQLARRLAEFTAACRRPIETDDHLHAVRIAAKRVRYTLDTFGDAIPADDRLQLKGEMKAVQEVLGRFNDAVVARQHIHEVIAHVAAYQPTLAAAVLPDLEQLMAHYATMREAERGRFHDWRTDWLARTAPDAAAEPPPPAAELAST